MKKSALFIAVILISVLAFNTSAATFSDISNHWAKDTITSMVDIGIIKGYEDNTFRPERAVSKAEALVLLSRVAGYSDESSENFIDVAVNTYSDLLDAYSTSYKKEVSYLLYNGVLEKSDLSVYISDSVASEPLKRYEAAILLTKIMGAEDEIKGNTTYTMSYADVAEIPSSAKPYVDYVSEKDLMKGMDGNKFEPMYNVTRAQMVTLLYRIIPTLNYSYESGTLNSYTAASGIAKIAHDGTDATSSVFISPSTTVILDGDDNASISDVPLGSYIRITYSNSDVSLVEAISPDIDETVSGVYVNYSKLTDGTIITVKDPLTNEKTNYSLDATVSVTKNGSTSSLANLYSNDAVTLKLKNNKVFSIIAENKIQTVAGTVSKINLSPEFAITVKSGGEEFVYTTYNSVTVRRNGAASSIDEVCVGDNVTLTLQYGIISEVVAQSTISKREGSIQEIVISVTPSITVKSGNSTYEYSMLRDVEIVRDGQSCEIYDLRLGDTATLSLEGATVTKIVVESAVSGANITGTVKYVNTSYGYITLEEGDVYIFTANAKIQDNTGKSMTMSSVKPGVSITVFGTESAGSYEAKLIVIN